VNFFRISVIERLMLNLASLATVSKLAKRILMSETICHDCLVVFIERFIMAFDGLCCNLN